jgi:hypothetical protein
MMAYREIPDFQTYEPNTDAPWAFIIDIDGTVADKGPRKFYDESCVDLDAPIIPVIRLVQALVFRQPSMLYPLFFSGRTEGCRDATVAWIRRHIMTGGFALHMRPVGDNRPDYVVKYEMFRRHVDPFWYVQFVIDDRNQVVDMWRTMGLTCLQVAPGDF